jgi:two-component system response regulator NreC
MTDLIRVLIVDDHAIVRAGLRMLIENQEDMTVVGDAANSADALRLTRSQRPQVALIDLALGADSGLDLIRTLSADHPATRCVALTMHDDVDHMQAVVEAGGSGYVPKQAAHNEVLSAIRVVVEGRAYFSLSLDQLRARRPGGYAPPRPGIRETLELLTPREREVLNLIARGLTHGEIASELGISLKTVETHRQHVCEKTGIRARALLVRFAQDSGLLDRSRA